MKKLTKQQKRELQNIMAKPEFQKDLENLESEIAAEITKGGNEIVKRKKRKCRP